MTENTQTRKLSAILAADVAGYSRLMAQDDAATVQALNDCREIFRSQIETHHGRLVDMTGDSVLAEFASALSAVGCAGEVQEALKEKNASVPQERRMQFRIGINVGDILQQADGTIYGDGVNIAARLESIGEPGGITISGTVYDQIKGRVRMGFDFIGEQSVKNIPEPVRAYRSVAGLAAPPSTQSTAGMRRRVPRVAIIGIAVLVAAFVSAYHFNWHKRLGISGAANAESVLSLPAGPTVAVLPFENLSGVATQDYFANGITQDVMAALSRFRDLRVVLGHAPSRAASDGSAPAKPAQLFNAAYVLDGSVRHAGDTLRVTARLTSVADSSLLWSQSYDRSLSAKDLFAVQDAIVESVVSTIGGADGVIARRRLASTTSARPQGLESYECVLLAYAYGREISQESHSRAKVCLEEVVKKEPNYADALAALSMIYEHQSHMGFNATQEYDPLRRALELAQRAVALEPNNASAHRQLAMVYFHLHELEPFYQHAQRAVELNPNDPTNLGYLGLYISWSGKLQWGNSLVRKAMSLNPEIPQWFNQVLAFEHYLAGEYKEGLAIIEKIHEKGNFWNDIWMLVYLGQLGRTEDSARVYARLQTMRPGYSVADYGRDAKTWNVPENWIALIQDGLRKSKVPETTPGK